MLTEFLKMRQHYEMCILISCQVSPELITGEAGKKEDKRVWYSSCTEFSIHVMKSPLNSYL